MIEVTDPPPKLAKTKAAHDRGRRSTGSSIREGIRPRLAESLDLALKLADGRVLALVESPRSRARGLGRAAPEHPPGLPGLRDEPAGDRAPQLQLQQPARRLPGLRGAGLALGVPARAVGPRSLAVVVPGRRRPLDAPGRGPEGPRDARCARPRLPGPPPPRRRRRPWSPGRRRSGDAFWSGEPDGPFPGLAAMLERAYQEARGEGLRRALDVYREEVVCPACGGSRLRPEARAVRFGGPIDPRADRDGRRATCCRSSA